MNNKMVPVSSDNSGSEDRKNSKVRYHTLYSKGEIVIEADEQELFAYLTFTPSASLTKLEEQHLKSALTDAGIVFGLDVEAIRKVTGSRKTLSREVIARGIPGKYGKPPKLDYKFPVDPYQIKGAKDDSEKVDYRDRGQLPYVQKGELLAVLIPGTDPIPGTSVTGREIKATIVMASGLEPGWNVVVEDERYLAKINGGPRLDDRGRIEVAESWVIRGDIDIRTGNIDYPGNVDIKGVVNPGFEVQAKSIRVYGVENRSKLDARDEIVISGGILGGTVNAGGSLRARFINNANVNCGSNVDVQLSIVNSEINSGGKVSAQTIIGGTVTALYGIECVNLSSGANRSTVIFGIDPIKQVKVSDLVKRKVEIEGQIQQVSESIAPLVKKLDEVDKLKNEFKSFTAEFNSLRQRVAHSTNLEPETRKFFTERIEELKLTLHSHENEIRGHEKEIVELRMEYGDQERDLRQLKAVLENLDEEHHEIVSTEEVLPSMPKVIVKGNALLGTRISSSRARLVLRKDLSRVVFWERKFVDKEKAKEPDAPPKRPRFRISVERL